MPNKTKVEKCAKSEINISKKIKNIIDKSEKDHERIRKELDNNEDLQDDIEDLENVIEDLENDMEDLEDNIEELEDNIKDLKNDIEDLDDIEEPDEIEDLDDIEDPDEVEDPDEIEDPEEIEDLDDIEDPDEIEDLDDIEDPDDIEYPDDIEKLVGIEEKKNRQILTIDDVRKIAQDRYGELMSDKYINTRQKLEFKCSNNHIFTKTMNAVQQGYWCSICRASRYISESITIEIMNILFNCTFEKVRPKWLNGLELDGYTQDLRIGIEYDGAQHFKVCFGMTEQDLQEQQKRDRRKNKLCKENNITLIRVPYTVKHKDITLYIKNECKKLNIAIPNDVDIDYRTFKHLYINNSKQLEELKSLVQNKKGTLLTDNYVSCNEKVKLKCEKGHIFTSSHRGIKHYNSWCGVCKPKKIKHTIQEINETIEHMNIKCISKEYINVRTKLTFKCQCGNRWDLSFYEFRKILLRKKFYCDKCMKNDTDEFINDVDDINESLTEKQKLIKKNMWEKLVDYVKKNDGIIISSFNDYDNSKSKLKFKCNNDHEFGKAPTLFLHGAKIWCNECIMIKKSEENQKIIKAIELKYGAECVSDNINYNKISRQLKWKCKNGHIFLKAIYGILKFDSFCCRCPKDEGKELTKK
jgi:hypothetical protein